MCHVANSPYKQGMIWLLWTDEMRLILDGPDGWAYGWISKEYKDPQIDYER